MIASRFRRMVLALVLCVPVAACDPCFGTVGCNTGPVLNYSGRVIDRETDRPVSGVRVAFERTKGVEMFPSTVSAVSDADGYFTLRGEANEVGWVYGNFIVEPPGLPSYDLEFRLHSQLRGGEGGDLGRLVLEPYFIFIGDIRDANDRVIPDVHVDFRRTGGVMATPTETSLVAGPAGDFVIVFKADEYGTIEGEFTLRPSDGRPARVVPVEIHTSHTIHLPYGTWLRYR